jgi:hypothetical protein
VVKKIDLREVFIWRFVEVGEDANLSQVRAIGEFLIIALYREAALIPKNKITYQ